jgi:hypothetical protein
VSRVTWLRRRLARVLGPTAVYAALVSVVVVVLDIWHVANSAMEYAGWAVAMHLWFLAVYVVVVSLAPIAIAAQRRWGLLAPGVLVLGVAVVDAATLGGHIPYLHEVVGLLGIQTGRRADLLRRRPRMRVGRIKMWEVGFEQQLINPDFVPVEKAFDVIEQACEHTTRKRFARKVGSSPRHGLHLELLVGLKA